MTTKVGAKWIFDVQEDGRVVLESQIWLVADTAVQLFDTA